jgi:hypothetical protein
MSEPLLEELARWLVKYKRRCKYCGKKVRCGEEFSNIWNVWFGKTQFLPKEYLFDREAVVELFHF